MLLNKIKSLSILTVSIIFISMTGSIAGSVGYTMISPFMDWDPDCSLPSEPFFSQYDNYAIDDYNAYVADMESYISCIESEAAGDLRTLQMAIENGLEAKQSEAIRKVEEVKSNLEMMKY